LLFTCLKRRAKKIEGISQLKFAQKEVEYWRAKGVLVRANKTIIGGSLHNYYFVVCVNRVQTSEAEKSLSQSMAAA
jgi:hypothetical protein